jgi:hypothetical protein
MTSRAGILRPLLLAFFLCAGVLALPGHAAAQVDTIGVAADSLYTIRLTDGSVIYGRIVERTDESVTIETQAGVRVTLRRGQIESMTAMQGRVVNGEVWPQDPHATRLFFGPTARAVPQGQGYLGVYELFFPFVSYGVTDRFTISAGTPIVPEVIGRIFYLAPKFEVVRTPSASAAVGVLALFATQEFDGSAGLLYGVGTVGGSDQALTVGAAVPFYAAEGGSGIVNEPVFMVGGESRVGRRTKLITENYLFPQDGALISGGIRFFGERLSADFGIGAAVGDGETGCCLPLVNFVYTF